MKRKTLLVIAVTVAVLIVTFVAKRMHYVDTKPAVALGGEFFSNLKRGQVGNAIGLYSGEFRQQRGEDWTKILLEITARYGPVTGYTFLDAKIAPVAKAVCVVVRYQVTRSTLSSEERLTVCPGKSATQMAIAGHQILRLDTQQKVEAGIVVQDKKITSIETANRNIGARTPEAVQVAANEFYNRMAAEQYDAIYDSSSDDFKASGSRNGIVSFLKKANQMTGGGCAEPSLTKTTRSPGENGDFLYLAYDRVCRNGDIHDGMSWKLANDKARLASYYLNSSDATDLPLVNVDDEEDLSLASQKALKSTENFYRDVAAHQYDAIFDLTSERLRDPANRGALVRLLEQVDETAGACGAGTLTDTSYTTSTAGLFVEMSFTRKCARRDIMDRFTWKIMTMESFLDGYYVSGAQN
ncbi:MAG TPA: hypothetical protein VN946_26510 [Terriglobales bacterium]|nr:hypothetical protein [Terriglobales bacterium]